MGYRDALEAAGLDVIDFRRFGSYQGVWIAIISNGMSLHAIRGHYGSCSGCDSWEAYESDTYCWSKYDKDHNSAECEDCQYYDTRLVEFGQRYVDDMETIESLAQFYIDQSYWSSFDNDDEQAEFVLSYLDQGTYLADQLRAKIKMERDGES